MDTKQHLIVTREVTNVGSDRAQLSKMATDSYRHITRCEHEHILEAMQAARGSHQEDAATELRYLQRRGYRR